MSQTIVTTENNNNENDNKPMKGSWRASIRNSKGFNLMVDEIIQATCTSEPSKETRERVLDCCETLWKLGSADNCGRVNNSSSSSSNNSNNNGEVKKLRNEAILDANSEPVEIIEINKVPHQMKDSEKQTKNKSKKTTKKSCDC
jgi:hypothetical protein